MSDIKMDKEVIKMEENNIKVEEIDNQLGKVIENIKIEENNDSELNIENSEIEINEKAGTILQCGNEFLGVLQRSSKLFGFSKGTVEKDENFTMCAQRELWDETGIFVPLSEYEKLETRSFTVDSNYFSKKNNKINEQKDPYKYVFYWIKLNSQYKPKVKIQDTKEIEGYEWCNLSEWWKKRRDKKVGAVMGQALKQLQAAKNKEKLEKDKNNKAKKYEKE